MYERPSWEWRIEKSNTKKSYQAFLLTTDEYYQAHFDIVLGICLVYPSLRVVSCLHDSHQPLSMTLGIWNSCNRALGEEGSSGASECIHKQALWAYLHYIAFGKDLPVEDGSRKRTRLSKHQTFRCVVQIPFTVHAVKVKYGARELTARNLLELALSNRSSR